MADLQQLFIYAILQFFTFHERLSGDTRSLGMTPDQFVGIQVRRVTGKEVQRQATRRAGYVLPDYRLLMRGQTIDHQMQWLLAAIHQVLEQINKQFTGQPAFVRGKPERAFGVDRRSGADSLALPWSIDYRGLATLSPRLAMDGIGTKTRFVPKKGISAPSALDCLAIAGKVSRCHRSMASGSR